MALSTDILRKATASAAILLVLGSIANSAALINPFVPGAASQSNIPVFSVPKSPFAGALALLSTPPRFEPQSVTEPFIQTASINGRAVRLAAPMERSDRQITPGKAGGVFDSVALPFKRLSALKRFSPIKQELSSKLDLRCDASGCSAASSTVGADAPELQSIRDRMNLVNVAVNRSIEYRRDIDTYGVMDRWATPSETLSRRQGDCEDIAILKMAVLRSYGVDPDAMSLVIVYDQKRRFYHAVLSVEVEGRNYVLDNLSSQVRLDTQLVDYVPLYSIRNGKGFLHGLRDKSKQLAATTSLSDIAPGEGLNPTDG
jgi:predicted transglutaminase-like cysteine proteinase